MILTKNFRTPEIFALQELNAIVNHCSLYDAVITVSVNNRTANAKSILGMVEVMLMNATDFTIVVESASAGKVMKDLTALLVYLECEVLE